jgi:hypothetical protein
MAGRGEAVVLMKGLYRPPCTGAATSFTGPGWDPIRLGHGMQRGWDFSSRDDMEFTRGNISLMSVLLVEGLSDINHSRGGGSSGPLGQSPGGSSFLRTSEPRQA